RAEAFPSLGEEAGDPSVKPVDLSPATRGDAVEEDFRDAVRIPLGIGENQCGAPGASEQQPAIDVEVFTQPLHVSDEMRSGVVVHLRRRVTRVRRTAAAAPLVEEHDAVAARVEEPHHSRSGSDPGPPCTTAAVLPDGLPYAAQCIRLPSPTSSMPSAC